MDTQGGTLGGGEVLQYVGNDDKYVWFMDEQLMKMFDYIPYVKIAIILLLVIAAILIVFAIFDIKSPFKGRAITSELEHMDRVKRRDLQIMQANKLMNQLTVIVEHTPLAMSKGVIDYWNYNLTRANIRIPGKSRIIRATEFHAIVVSVEVAVCAVFALLGLVINLPLGLILVTVTIVFANTLPMRYLRGLVKTKDNEIIENFADFYLMIHYVLLASAGTPIAGVMKSFDKTTNSEEMHRFVDVCIHYIDTYGEYEATKYIAKNYREIPQVGKLMRLIRQANEGGDVRAELIGFRDELLAAKKYAITQRMNKLVARARASFNLLYIVLVQAILSAMAIYIDDLGGASSFLG